MKLDLKLEFVFAPVELTFCPAFNYNVGIIKRTPLNHCSDLVPDYEQSTVFANELQRKCHVIVTSTRGENLPFQTAMVVVLISLVSLGLGVADCEGSDRRVTHFFVDTCRGNKT